MRTPKRVLTLAVVLAAGYAGVRWGGGLSAQLERAFGLPTSGRVEAAAGATPEVAERTLDRFERLRGGSAGSELALGGTELTAVVRHALPGIVPRGISEPTVMLEGGTLSLSARVAVAAFPHLPDLTVVLGFLPDTVSVDVRGDLVPVDQRVLALAVDRVRVARIALPRRMVGQMLEGLAGKDRDGAPADQLRVPLPDGLVGAYVRGDSLILVSRTAETEVAAPETSGER